MTEAVFAFLFDSWDRTNSLLLKRQSRYHYAISTYRDELPLLLNNLLDYPIQLTTYLLSCGLLSRLLRPTYCIATAHQPRILHTSPWVQPLEPMHYPFSYQLTDWFCSEVSTTCYFPHAQVPCGLSTCVLSTTSALLLQPPVLSVIATSR